MDNFTLSFKKDFRSIKKGAKIKIKREQTNFWVGRNGTGKSLASQLILSILKEDESRKNLVSKKHWKALISGASGIAEFAGPKISKLFYNSDKSRQTQFLDMDALLEGNAGNVSKLWASEGENNIMELNEAFAYVTDPEALVIFDETDGKFDYFNKIIFFEKICKFSAATIIVITHDPFFLSKKEVFDFTDFTIKTGDNFYSENLKEYKKAVKAAAKAEKCKASN